MTPHRGLDSERLARLVDWDEDTFDEHFEDLTTLAGELGNDSAVAELARHLAAEASEDVRALAFDLLSVALTPDDRGLVPVIVDLAQQLGPDAGHDLRWSVAHALATADDGLALDRLLDLAADADSDVRWQVAYGIPTVLERLPARAVDVLLDLMRDADSDVRDWATFALGIQSEMDTPTIRAALVAATADVDPAVAEQAALALAQRGDPRGLPLDHGTS